MIVHALKKAKGGANRDKLVVNTEPYSFHVEKIHTHKHTYYYNLSGNSLRDFYFAFRSVLAEWQMETKLTKESINSNKLL